MSKDVATHCFNSHCTATESNLYVLIAPKNSIGGCLICFHRIFQNNENIVFEILIRLALIMLNKTQMPALMRCRMKSYFLQVMHFSSSKTVKIWWMLRIQNYNSELLGIIVDSPLYDTILFSSNLLFTEFFVLKIIDSN